MTRNVYAHAVCIGLRRGTAGRRWAHMKAHTSMTRSCADLRPAYNARSEMEATLSTTAKPTHIHSAVRQPLGSVWAFPYSSRFGHTLHVRVGPDRDDPAHATCLDHSEAPTAAWSTAVGEAWVRKIRSTSRHGQCRLEVDTGVSPKASSLRSHVLQQFFIHLR